MGQVMAEGCKNNCHEAKPYSQVRRKSGIYLSGLASQLPDKDLTQKEDYDSLATITQNNQFLLSIKSIPSHYIEFVNYLFVARKKFHDNIFVADHNAITWKGVDFNSQNWMPLSDMRYQNVRVNWPKLSENKSPVFQILQLIDKNAPSQLQHLKPLYVPQVGLAICHLYINGVLQEVVIDDLIPANHLRNYTKNNYWYFLVEKSLAKILGNYALIQQFTLLELFQEITGMPIQLFQPNKHNWRFIDSLIHEQKKKKINSHKQIAQQTVFQLHNNLNSQVYSVRYIKDFTIKSVRLNVKDTSIFRIVTEKDQVASLRISFLNRKYEQSTELSVGQCEFRLYKQQLKSFTLVEKNTSSFGNNNYLGKTFMKIIKGEYILCVKPNNSRRTSLVCYSGEGASLKQIISKETVKQILNRLEEIGPNCFQEI